MKRTRGAACICATCSADCVHAGKQRKQKRKPQRGLFEFTAPALFENAVAPALPADTLGQGAHTAEQKRAETLGDVVTYVAKGAALGVAGMCVSIPSVLMRWWIFPLPWYTPLVVLPTATGIGIFVSIAHPQEWVVGFVENVLQRDVDGDDRVGKNEPERVLGTVEVTGPGKQVRYLEDVPLSDELAQYLAAFLASPPRTTFAESSAAQYHVDTAHFEKMRDELFARSMIDWKNPRNHRSGYTFTRAAYRALGQLRELCVSVRA